MSLILKNQRGVQYYLYDFIMFGKRLDEQEHTYLQAVLKHITAMLLP